MNESSWDDLRIVLAIVRAGSFTRAAAVLETTQPTVSRRVARLEDRLGVRLFLRDGRDPVPTVAGLELARHAEEMERASHAAARAATGADDGAAGVVRVAVLEIVAVEWLVPSIARFNAMYPQIRLEIVSGNALVDLGRNEADIAVRLMRPTHGDLVCQQVLRTSMAVLGAPAYLAPRRGRPTRALDWVRWARDQHYVDPEWAVAHISDPPVLYASSSMVLMAAIRSGLGVSLMPGFCGPWLGLDVHPEPVPGDYAMWLITHKALRRLPRVDAVWRYLLELGREIAAGPRPDHRWLPRPDA